MTTYYIKSHGNDALDGKSVHTAWKTLEKIFAMRFKKNDKIEIVKNR
jgi:hypothetical protein